MKKQRGGTILGVILGLVAGLGAALLVAIYVTKVPVPFVNKGQIRSADQDVQESKKNKDWDPNAPLYGKNPLKPLTPSSAAMPTTKEPAEANPVFVPTPDPVPVAATKVATPAKTPAPTPDPVVVKTPPPVKTPAPVVPTAPVPTPKPAAKETPTPAPTPKVEVKPVPAPVDTLGDLAKARSAATSTSDPFSYFVQVGAFRTIEDAEGQRAKLSLSGIQTRITEREQSGRTVFRVRVGPFDKKDEADKTKEKLEASGIETALVRVQR